MAKEVIKIKINKETGNATVLTEGFTGKTCEAATEELEVQLGRVTHKERTAEYYKPEPPDGNFLKGV